MAETLTDDLTGLVFDIQRTSLNDGPGIRTTVFLKGCPLRCLWCHNPESIAFRAEISFDATRCVHCFACVDVCPHGAQQVVDGRHVLDHDLCQACGECLSVCAYEGLRRIGEPMTVAAVLAVVQRDVEYYRSSGGGMTLSGGEPLAQFEFTLALLAAARQNGIHTCLETNGCAAQERSRQALPLVDLFLFDYKATDPAEHTRLTGVSNQLILENFEYLYRQGAAIVLRCPLVPGINDTAVHLEGIARLAAAHPNLRGVEIMAYHAMGVEKGRRVGLDPALADLPTAGEEQKAAWLAQLHALGCTRAVIG